MEDKIILKNITLHGYHGVYEEEKRTKQKFVFNIILFLNLSLPGKTDELKDTIDYVEVHTIIKNTFNQTSFRLLECMAQSMAEAILSKWSALKRITIEIQKPSALAGAEAGCASVQITRNRP